MADLEPHVASPTPNLTDARVTALARLLTIVDRLRAPDGCPWDRKQTVQSMAPHLIEEAHEVLEAIETGNDAEIAEEAGDVLMVVALICKIGEEAGRFDLARAAQAISEKLIRRHPHVFGELKVGSADEVVVNWEAIKKTERAEKREDTSALAGVPRALPALQRAQRICGKAISAGFRWSDASGAFAKLEEEQRELAEALQSSGLLGAASTTDPEQSTVERERVEHELGDVLLAAAYLAHYVDMDPEKLVRDAVRRFEGRFRSMESDLTRPMKECSLDELMAAWERAKSLEN